MSAITCAVTGANGFVGQNLVRRFQSLGWRVVALTHRPDRVPPGIETRRFTLGKPLAPGTLKGIDVLVHTAYDFSVRGWADICRVNVVGSDYLFDAATRAGVKRIIQISSLSAFEGCKSHYGLSKLGIEETARIRGGIAIRPGIIYGKENGGLMAKIEKIARLLPIIPMIGRGDYPIFTCHVEDLGNLVLHIAQAEQVRNEIVTAANPVPVTLLDIVKVASTGKWRMIIAIPWRWVAAGLWLVELTGLRLGFRSDSVKSLVNANRTPDFNATQKLPVEFRAFEYR